MYDAPWARGIVGKQVSVEGMAQQTRNGHSASAAEVAALAGVSRQTVSKWENGSADPSTTNLLALAKLYGVTAEDLLRGIDRSEE